MRTVPVEQLILEAIRGRTPLALCYEGDAGAARTVHPHVLYRTSTGKVCADSYQIDGPTSSGGSLPDWRPFDLAKITHAELLDGEFSIAPGLDVASPKYANGLLAHV
jgi:hypothetical protein